MNDPKYQASYTEMLNKFDSQLTKHMPQKLPNSMTGFGSGLELTEESECLYITYKYSDQEEIQEIKDEYGFSDFSKYESSDSCILTLKNYGNLNGVTPTSHSCPSVIPMPQFVNYESRYDSIREAVIWEFTEHIETVILDSEVGSKHNLNNEYISSKWGTGYTRGISINRKENTLMFWVMNW
jgi:hypothetical protein